MLHDSWAGGGRLPLPDQLHRGRIEWKQAIDLGVATMTAFERITSDPAMLNGQPYIRGMRLTVRRVLEALATYADRGSFEPSTRKSKTKISAKRLNMRRPILRTRSSICGRSHEAVAGSRSSAFYGSAFGRHGNRGRACRRLGAGKGGPMHSFWTRRGSVRPPWSLWTLTFTPCSPHRVPGAHRLCVSESRV